MNQINTSRENLDKIITDIFNFEKSLTENDKIKTTKKNIDKLGYLIDKKAFDTLKEKIKYKRLVKHISNPKDFAKHSCGVSAYNIKTKKCEPKKFNNSQDLLKAFNKKDEYIIISPLLNESINPNYNRLNEKEGLLRYQINSNNLIIFLNEFERIVFINNNTNIINNNSFLKIYNTIEIICNSIIEYYKFEKSLTKELNDNKLKNNNIKEGYLVDENWLDNWKKYIDYNNIKNLFLNKEDITKDIDKIKSNIYSYLDYNKIKFDECETIKYNDLNHLNQILQNKSLVLINIEFLEILKEYNKCIIGPKIAFINEYRKIKFLIMDNNRKIVESFEISAYNNIISLKVNYCFNTVNDLVKLYISQEKLKKTIKSKNEKIKQNNCKLLDKELITNFKKYYDYDLLIDYIKNLKNIKAEINYLEKDKGKTKIDNYHLLQEIDWNYFDSIYSKKSIDDLNNNNIYNIDGFQYKIKEYKNKTLKYLDNFEIIDSKIEINGCPGGLLATYFIDNDRLLIQYKINRYNINYIIGHINEDNSFISEYLIEFLNIFNINCQDIIKNFGINYFLKEINKKNESGYYNINKTVGYCYQLQSNEINKKLSNHLKEEIKTLIQLFLFNIELKNKVIKSKNNNSFIISDKCYLLNNQWISKYKDYYLYDKICQVLNLYQGNLYNETNLNYILNDIEKNKELFELYYRREEKEFSKGFELENNFMEVDKSFIVKGKKTIFYYNNFIIVNKELYDKLIVNRINNSNDCYEERDYIINSGKILIKIDTNSVYQILIGELKNVDGINNLNNENEISQILILNFINEYETNVIFKNLLTDQFDNYLKYLKYNNYQIYNDNLSKVLGEGYPLIQNNGMKINNFIIPHENKNLNIFNKMVNVDSFHVLPENNFFNNKELDRAKKIIDEQNKKIESLQKHLKIAYNFNSKIKKDFNKKIYQKEEEIKQLKLQIENISKKELIKENDLVSIHFTSLDQRVFFSIPCSKKDIFAKVEERLYQEYPKLREKNNYFLFDGKQILKFKTIEENKISSGQNVTLINNEDEEEE